MLASGVVSCNSAIEVVAICIKVFGLRVTRGYRVTKILNINFFLFLVV